ncbi:MAG: GspE/PulE family protein [Campylobacterota bacterium]|nr:GspE/PulE family protein [Campylobacterota bacterium]
MIKSIYNYDIDYSLIKDIDPNILKQYSIIPIEKNELFIMIATSNNHLDIKDLNTIFNFPIKLIYLSSSDLEFELKYIRLKKELFRVSTQAINFIDIQTENSYILEFLELILEFSIKNFVSDIHIECLDKSVIIRLRLDGVLQQYFRFDIMLYPIISSIIKFLSNLDISQKRVPLDGRFTKSIDNYSYDFRVSTVPTIFGESIVLRVLDNKNIKKNIDLIGFDDNSLSIIKNRLQLTQGLILITGPTGSGKTTSLYSMLNYINKKEKKVITIEDPVEYKLDGVIQININTDINLDYHTVLKNILRQDPDILMIGEIRDTISLNIALRAALTGHLVISTLHTNNSIETISRLIDLKAEPYLVATTLKMVLSQRLLRQLCPKCKLYNNDTGYYTANGCKDCNFTGYYKREIVSEVLQIDEKISKMISKNKTILDILHKAQKHGFKTLQDNGTDMLKKGLTSQDEYISKISDDI